MVTLITVILTKSSSLRESGLEKSGFKFSFIVELLALNIPLRVAVKIKCWSVMECWKNVTKIVRTLIIGYFIYK